MDKQVLMEIKFQIIINILVFNYLDMIAVIV